jgi:hypothetical protein
MATVATNIDPYQAYRSHVGEVHCRPLNLAVSRVVLSTRKLPLTLIVVASRAFLGHNSKQYAIFQASRRISA